MRPEYPDGCQEAIRRDEAACEKAEQRAELREQIQQTSEEIEGLLIEIAQDLGIPLSSGLQLERLETIMNKNLCVQELFAEYVREE